MKRAEILDKAKQTVTKDREDVYGEPEDSFEMIALLWNDYLFAKGYVYEEPFTKRDVAIMMILLKIARIMSGKPKADNWIDIAGYAACGGELDTRGGTEYAELAKSKTEIFDIFDQCFPDKHDCKRCEKKCGEEE